ncbi:hypothetical protein GCM10011609_42340 [Lentzea pudingi]|uniref:Uncharacterized protein n=1 Tax=Lentzea pudingi TaxID=1789439 RepID=A0ABQ2I5T2_9PSEU|nr:hypothetical protein GCM10011609_42340 [Lentzea pudingi]
MSSPGSNSALSGVTRTDRSGRSSLWIDGTSAVSFSSGLVSGVDGADGGAGCSLGVLGGTGVDGSLGGVEDGGAGCSDVDGGGVLGSLGAAGGVGSTLETGVSGSCASAPVVAVPNASTAAVVKAPILSRARLTDLSDTRNPPRTLMVCVRCR